MQELGLQENVVFSLRALYGRHGYTRYKMSKFEEYDLYARNKEFLISDNVITFTDLNGKLMALKPDVTLSIVKNSRDDAASLQKLYYNENVYRVTKGSRSFREILQVGLECIGDVDDYCICEVLTLAAQSLLTISPDCVLDISHLGLISEFMTGVGVPRSQMEAVFSCIGGKNSHELASLLRSCGVAEEAIAVLRELVLISGAPDAVLPRLRRLLAPFGGSDAIDQLLRILEAMEDGPARKILRFDFSAVDDIHYYNGIVFKGFIQGLPSAVLSGGQYDNLMRRMRRRSRAIGFAVYTDALERLEQNKKEYDVDTVLLYCGDEDLSVILAQAKALARDGSSVLVQKQKPDAIRYRQLVQLRGSEVEILENNA